jgi:hypothetical protein
MGFLLNRTADLKKVVECAPVVAIAQLTIRPRRQGAAISLCLAQFTFLLGSKNLNQTPLQLVRVENWVPQVVAIFALAYWPSLSKLVIGKTAIGYTISSRFTEMPLP